MPRPPRVAPGGQVYHVINRANGRLRLFRKEEDFLAFYRVLRQAHERTPPRLLGWCVMGNHCTSSPGLAKTASCRSSSGTSA